MQQIWDVVGRVTSSVHVIDVKNAAGTVIPFKVSSCPRMKAKSYMTYFPCFLLLGELAYSG